MSLMHPAIWKEIKKKKFSLQYLRKPSGLYHILPFAVYPSNQVFYLQIQIRLATCIKKKKAKNQNCHHHPKQKPNAQGLLGENSFTAGIHGINTSTPARSL